MATLLIKAIDATNPDPDKDKFCYKFGHIVDIYEDGRISDTQHCNGLFYIIHIPGIVKSDIMEFLAKKTDGVDENGEPVSVALRDWVLEYDNLPVKVKNALKKDNVSTVTTGMIKSYLKKTSTGEYPTWLT